jgi:hypothetical protein
MDSQEISRIVSKVPKATGLGSAENSLQHETVNSRILDEVAPITTGGHARTVALGDACDSGE